MPHHQIICGDVIPTLKALPDEYVDMLMTSVPYYGLRNYGEDTVTIWGGDENCEHDFNNYDFKLHSGRGDSQKSAKYSEQEPIPDTTLSSAYCSKCGAWFGQLGLEETSEFYISHLRMVFAEAKRVLKKTGTCWVNIGDSYASGKSRYNSSPHTLSGKGRDEPMSWNKPDLYKQGYEDTCMCLIPELFLMMMVFDLGFILRNKNVWKKDNPTPSSVKNRFNNVWEPVYFFTKNNKPVYFYNDKSGAIVDKKPTSQIEGVDWDWKTCPFCDGTGVVKENEYTLAKWFEGELKMRFGEPCKRCKTTGRIKVNYWHSVDYFFDLDAVRKPYTKPLNRWGGNEVKIPEKTKWKSDDEKAKWCMSIGDRQSRPNPSGKNPGDVVEISKEEWLEYCDYLWVLSHESPDFFSINTQPFPKAHFAVFPEKLVEKPLKCGCPAEVCSVCGMARVRITRNEEISIEEAMQNPAYLRASPNKDGRYYGEGTKDYKSSMAENPSEAKRRMLKAMRTQSKTIGWTDCQCEGKDKYKPGICIDPFGGSGTVGIVAEKLGRSSILIDIKRDYCEMAIKRLKPLVEQTKLTGEQSTIKKEGF